MSFNKLFSVYFYRKEVGFSPRHRVTDSPSLHENTSPTSLSTSSTNPTQVDFRSALTPSTKTDPLMHVTSTTPEQVDFRGMLHQSTGGTVETGPNEAELKQQDFRNVLSPSGKPGQGTREDKISQKDFRAVLSPKKETDRDSAAAQSPKKGEQKDFRGVLKKTESAVDGRNKETINRQSKQQDFRDVLKSGEKNEQSSPRDTSPQDSGRSDGVQQLDFRNVLKGSETKEKSTEKVKSPEHVKTSTEQVDFRDVLHKSETSPKPLPKAAGVQMDFRGVLQKTGSDSKTDSVTDSQSSVTTSQSLTQEVSRENTMRINSQEASTYPSVPQHYPDKSSESKETFEDEAVTPGYESDVAESEASSIITRSMKQSGVGLPSQQDSLGSDLASELRSAQEQEQEVMWGSSPREKAGPERHSLFATKKLKSLHESAVDKVWHVLFCPLQITKIIQN